MKKYTKYALAKLTQRVYKIGRKKYIKFCKTHQRSPLPLKQSTLRLFVTFLARSVAFKTIKLYLCTLKHYSVSHGYKNPVPSMHRLYILLEGIKRKLGAVGKRKPRFPITIHNLKQASWSKRFLELVILALIDTRLIRFVLVLPRQQQQQEFLIVKLKF